MKAVKIGDTRPTISCSGVAIAASLMILAGCATAPGYNSGINLPGGGGVSIPGGGSSGGGSSGGGSSGGGSSGGGMGMPGGGSSGGGMGMPGGGSSGGGMSGGGSSGGGMSGGGSTGGGPGGMGLPGNAAGGDGADCQDGGISGGGIGGGLGCDQSGDVGQFPGDPNRAEQLGEELDKSVGDFDEAIGEEQRQVSSVGRDTEGFGGGGSRGGNVGLGEQAAGASGQSAGGSQGGGGAGGAGGTGESQAGPLGDMSDQEIQARIPDDIEVSAYDDIVARQLREAAIAEDDPVLRERLWEEYRKYKGLK